MLKRQLALVGKIIAAAALMNGCGPSLPPGRISETWRQAMPSERGAWDALFVADSQLHNVTGSYIKTQSTVSAIASAVAVRPSELNLLSSLVLDAALEPTVRR